MRRLIIECSKLAQKEYNVRYDWVGKMICWKLCKKLNFNHTNKWYMHKTEYVFENKTHKIFWDFEIKIDHLTPARKPNLVHHHHVVPSARISSIASSRSSRLHPVSAQSCCMWVLAGRPAFAGPYEEVHRSTSLWSSSLLLSHVWFV